MFITLLLTAFGLYILFFDLIFKIIVRALLATNGASNTVVAKIIFKLEYREALLPLFVLISL
jgi:hypothetical protein